MFDLRACFGFSPTVRFPPHFFRAPWRGQRRDNPSSRLDSAPNGEAATSESTAPWCQSERRRSRRGGSFCWTSRRTIGSIPAPPNPGATI